MPKTLRDVGAVTIQLVALVLAIVAFVIVTLMGFDVVTAKNIGGWTGLGLALFAIAHLP